MIGRCRQPVIEEEDDDGFDHRDLCLKPDRKTAQRNYLQWFHRRHDDPKIDAELYKLVMQNPFLELHDFPVELLIALMLRDGFVRGEYTGKRREEKGRPFSLEPRAQLLRRLGLVALRGEEKLQLEFGEDTLAVRRALDKFVKKIADDRQIDYRAIYQAKRTRHKRELKRGRDASS